MSITTIMLMNIGAAIVLSAILAAVMLAPTRLRRPLADGSLNHRHSVPARHPRAATQAGRGRPAVWRPAQDS